MHEIKPHRNAVIGIKKLSQADLGSSRTSHQTHIGLLKVHFLVLTIFIWSISVVSLLRAKQRSYCVCLITSRITMVHLGAKIRKGANEELIFEGQDLNSVVREIRKVVGKKGGVKDWYLLWFATNNQHLVFVLFEFRSEFFDLLSAKLDGVKQRQQVYSNTEAFFVVMDVLEPYMKIEQ